MRFYNYKTPLEQHGIDLTIMPLFEQSYIRALYGRGARIGAVLGAFARRLGDLFRTSGFDAVWIEKEMLPWLPAIVELVLMPKDVPIVLDYDDAVFHRYDMHASTVVRAVLGRKLDRLMARADLVLAGNEYLADRARSAGARRISIVPTVIDLDRYIPSERPSSRIVTIGWIGSPSTAPYLDAVKPVVAELAESGLVNAVAIGARADQLAGSAFSAKEWTEESEVSSLRAIDIGIMPLADTPWEHGKCGYKLIQYMGLGLPVVASPVGVNRILVNEGNGFLASTVDEWRSALVALAMNPKLRLELGAAGREKIVSEYSLQVWAPRLASLLRGL